MSLTLILCDTCGSPLAWCKCPAGDALRRFYIFGETAQTTEQELTQAREESRRARQEEPAGRGGLRCLTR